MKNEKLTKWTLKLCPNVTFKVRNRVQKVCAAKTYWSLFLCEKKKLVFPYFTSNCSDEEICPVPQNYI